MKKKPKKPTRYETSPGERSEQTVEADAAAATPAPKGPHDPAQAAGAPVAAADECRTPATDAGGPSVADPVTGRAAQEETVESLLEKVTSLEDTLLRSRADFQNTQRRAEKERAQAVRFANATLMLSLLGVVDDFERSLVAAEDSGATGPVVDGVRLVYENLLKALRGHGLQVIDAMHEPFDPHVHEALLQQAAEDHPPGTIIEEIAKGYRLHDRVLRPTKAVVSKAHEQTSGAESSEAVEESGHAAGRPGEGQ